MKIFSRFWQFPATPTTCFGFQPYHLLPIIISQVYHLVNTNDICYIGFEVILMTVGKDKKRILITLPEKLIEEVKILADADKRTLSNYIEKVLQDIVKGQ